MRLQKAGSNGTSRHVFSLGLRALFNERAKQTGNSVVTDSTMSTVEQRESVSWSDITLLFETAYYWCNSGAHQYHLQSRLKNQREVCRISLWL